jgi:quinol-cytochrome oxidoreductase complex cytochrome b subunit
MLGIIILAISLVWFLILPWLISPAVRVLYSVYNRLLFLTFTASMILLTVVGACLPTDWVLFEARLGLVVFLLSLVLLNLGVKNPSK